MKRIFIITLCTFLFAITLSAQENIFEKFENMKGVTTIYISPKMFSIIKELKALDSSNVKIDQIINKLSSLHILSCENKEVAAKLRSEAAYIGKDKSYENLMKVKEENEHISIYMKEGEDNDEYVLLMDNTDEFTIMIFKGKLTLEDIQKVINKTSRNNSNTNGQEVFFKRFLPVFAIIYRHLFYNTFYHFNKNVSNSPINMQKMHKNSIKRRDI